MTFWRDFYAWHLATEHPWDVGLKVRAMSMSFEGMARDIGESLVPAMRAATEAFRSLAEALR